MAENEIPVPKVAQDSWAWKDDAHPRGANYYHCHKDDKPHADAPMLRKLGRWLFNDPHPDDPAKAFPNLKAFHKFLQTNFDCTGKDTTKGAKKINTYLSQRVPGRTAFSLSHAQLVQIFHVLVDQEDVRLVAPYDPDTLPW